MRSFLFAALLALVALAPLPLGSNRPLFWSVTSFTAGVLFILWGASLFFRLQRLRKTPLLYGAIFFFLVAISWAAIQATALGPEAWWHPVWGEASYALGEEGLKGAISVNPHRSITALMRLLSYGAVFWISMRICGNPKRSSTLVKTIAIAGLLYSGYGLAVFFSGNNSILWFDKWAYPNDLTSTFVNRNSFASYAGISLICSTAILVKITLRRVSRTSTAKTIAAEFLRSVTTKGSIYFIAFFIILTAIFLTHSRAGLFCSLAGLAVFFMAFSFSRAYKPLYGLLAGVFIASISTGIFFVSGEITVSRIDYEKTISDYRIPLYQISLQALEKRPYLGYGYGAYEEIIPAFSNQEANKYVRAAHNTYLENAIELGLVGACSLFLSIGMLVLICVRKVLERSSNTIYPCVGLGVTALLGAHSLVDFPLQMPAIAMTYAAIMGASCAQSSRHKMKKERGAKGGQRPRRRRINDLPVNRF